MVDYKEGDLVERFDGGSFPDDNMIEGHLYIVRYIRSSTDVFLQGCEGVYDTAYFRLAKNKIVIDILKDL